MSFGTVQAEKMTTESGYSLGAGNASSFKNRIINGNCAIDQRNAGASVTATVTGAFTYTLDRYAYLNSAASKFSVQQNAGSVTPPVGFKNYLGVTSLAATSIGTSEYYQIIQTIEGYNIADLNWGSASAKPIVLSFYVYSSLTGSFGGALLNADNSRAYPFSYTISSANTWTQINIPISGDTTGTWLSTNGAGVQVRFSMGLGSTYTTTGGAWASGVYGAPTGSVNMVSTNGATWYMTGLQFEVGTVATSFDFRSYGTELALCQRYFYSMGGTSTFEQFSIGSATGTTDGRFMMYLPVPMRTQPSIGQTGAFQAASGAGSFSGTFSAGTSMYFANSSNFAGTQNIGTDFFGGSAGSFSSSGTGAAYIIRANGSLATRVTFFAEL